MTENLEALRNELRVIDTEVSEALKALEEWFTDLHLGVDVPLGDDFVITKVNSKPRFVRLSDGYPVGDIKRGDRADFMKLWGSKGKIVAAAESELRAIIDDRKKSLCDTSR